MQTATEFSVLDYAINYAANGFRVFPLHSIEAGKCTCSTNCTSPGKHPTTPRGVLDATTNESQIRAWFGEFGNPHANIGIATGKESGLVVVDFDIAKGANVVELFERDNVDMPDTTIIKTGAGLHFYYRYPSSGEIKNSVSRLGKFIDVRGQGGYVVAPPSRHASGARYQIQNDTDNLAEFPAVWLKTLNEPIAPAPAPGPDKNGNGLYVPPHTNLVIPESITYGTQHDTLFRLGCSLRAKGLSFEAIDAALQIVNRQHCEKPGTPENIRKIAQSAVKYDQDRELTTITGDDAADYENTLQPYSLDTFFDIDFPQKEILGFHIGKRDIAIIQAATNAGKTTLLRNIALCMAAGRAFMPFYDGHRAVKIGYFDFENDAQDVQRDLKKMFAVFTDDEKRSIKNNFIVIPKGLRGGELFQFNTHESLANEIITQNKVEFVLVDNVSAAYDLNDENSNAEVTRKVIKPLLKMAYKGDCAFLFAHHYGKAKNELESAGVHAGRGASALQSLSRTVINMFGDVSKGELVTVECAKRKTHGGQNYQEVFRLEDDRWFHHTTIVPPPKKQTAYQTIRKFMETIVYPDLVSTAEIINKFQNDFGVDSIKKAVNELFKDGFIEKPKHGFYCAKDLNNAGANQTVNHSANVRNFYEKDDDE